MPKAVKITPTSIEQIDDWETDEDYVNNKTAGYALNVPSHWKFKKFDLAFFILDLYEDDTPFNPLGTYISEKLKDLYEPYYDIIKGFMIIVNEDDTGLIDFTIDDLKYILQKIKLFKHLGPDKKKKNEQKFMEFIKSIQSNI